jgi:ABC transporter DrrB family efflux protein
MIAIPANAPTIHATRPSALTPPERVPGAAATAVTYAGRTIRQFVRTPQLIVVGALTSSMFLLIFRYVFGGAIQTGRVAYVDFLIPALAAVGGLFASGSVGVATDVDSGMFDRLQSLPVPRSALLLGRSLADTVLVTWSMFVTLALGFVTGFRIHGGLAPALGALVLCVGYGAAFTWPMIYIGLAAGTAQAAQGMAFMAFPFVFVSSAYVPVASMPGWMRPIAANQPVTSMVGSVRALVLGNDAQAVLGHSAAWFTARALLWCVVIVAVFASLATRRFNRR